VSAAVRFSRHWAMPSADTMTIPPLKAIVASYCRNRVSVDPFARNCAIATHTNDLDPSTSAASHMDAVEWLEMLASQGVAADVLIFDPPYSPRQVSECYKSIGRKVEITDTQTARFNKRCRSAIRDVVKVGGYVLSFGWNSVGMGAGFETVEIVLVCHGGAHNDTICVVDRMISSQTSLFP